MDRIVVVGGGYAGFYAAWGLERQLKTDEAEVVLIDPRSAMTYQPFLPEVMAGSVEARHAAISHRRHLHRTRLINGWVTRIDHSEHRMRVLPLEGEPFDLPYDTVVVTAGAVTRVLPVPGVTEQAIGMKHVEEAVAIRDRLLTNFDKAAELPDGPERRRLLTAVFVGGGFAGVEGFAELFSLARDLTATYPQIAVDDLDFHLVELSRRILPEVGDNAAQWVVDTLREDGAHVHLGTEVLTAEGGTVELSDGTVVDTDLLVWTTGNAANPVVATHTDLPVDRRGYVIVRPDLRVGTDEEPVADAWAAGDAAAVPDLTSPDHRSLTVPNAQNAVRQGKLLAENIMAVRAGRKPRPYIHHSLGAVATLGLGRGIFQYHRLVIRGLPAWVLHRGYHVLAIPTWERKIRVLTLWLTAGVFGRDIVSLASVQHPRDAFVSGGQPPDQKDRAI
jgi:NADH dehydrogenase